MNARLTMIMLVIPLVLGAQPARTSAISRGSMLIAGSASLVRTKSTTGTATQTSFSFDPELLRFFVPRLAVGGRVGLSYSSSDDLTSKAWLIGPAIRYFFADENDRIMPFLGASVALGSSTVQSSLGSHVRATTKAVDGSGGITFLLATHVGLTGEAFVRKTSLDSDSGVPTTTSESGRTQFGMRFGVSGFVY